MWRKLQEIFQERLHPEIVDRAAEKHRRQLARPHFFQIERVAGDIQQLQLLAKLSAYKCSPAISRIIGSL